MTLPYWRLDYRHLGDKRLDDKHLDDTRLTLVSRTETQAIDCCFRQLLF